MVNLSEITEGDVLQWNTVNGRAKGYVVVDGEGNRQVFLDETRSFRLVDVASTPSLKVTGHLRVK